MQRKLNLGVVPLLLMLAALPLAAQNGSTLSATKLAKIEDAIRAEMTQSKIPALSVAVVTESQLRYAKGFGAADLEDSSAAKASTVYRLGSLSKTITAVAVLQLAERGKLDLDAPVQKYCPAYPQKQWTLTTRQLLGHLGGVRDYNNQKFLEEYFSTRHYNSINDSLVVFKDDPLLQEPGTKFSYSTYGYNLLGCVVEGASASGYEEYVTENILKPAGMTQTYVDNVLRIIPERARGYGKTQAGLVRNTGLADTSNKIPAGGLDSTVEDLSRFAIALRKGTLVGRETVERMWTRQKTSDGKETPYGLGWYVGERNNLKEVYHGGAAAGFSTFLYLVPEKNAAVVLMTNLELWGKRRDELARQIMDVLLQ